jgi:hypothetical protein
VDFVPFVFGHRASVVRSNDVRSRKSTNQRRKNSSAPAAAKPYMVDAVVVHSHGHHLDQLRDEAFVLIDAILEAVDSPASLSLLALLERCCAHARDAASASALARPAPEEQPREGDEAAAAKRAAAAAAREAAKQQADLERQRARARRADERAAKLAADAERAKQRAEARAAQQAAKRQAEEERRRHEEARRAEEDARRLAERAARESEERARRDAMRDAAMLQEATLALAGERRTASSASTISHQRLRRASGFMARLSRSPLDRASAQRDGVVAAPDDSGAHDEASTQDETRAQAAARTASVERLQEEERERRAEEAAAVDVGRFNAMLQGAGHPPIDGGEWAIFHEWMDERTFKEEWVEFRPDDDEDLFVEVYTVWQNSEEYVDWLDRRRREVQHRLDNGEWDTDGEYDELAAALERLTRAWKLAWKKVRRHEVHIRSDAQFPSPAPLPSLRRVPSNP